MWVYFIWILRYLSNTGHHQLNWQDVDIREKKKKENSCKIGKKWNWIKVEIKKTPRVKSWYEFSGILSNTGHQRFNRQDVDIRKEKRKFM